MGWKGVRGREKIRAVSLLTTDHCSLIHFRSRKMAISKAKKAEKVELLKNELAASTTAIIGTFAKLTVAQDFELRKVVREAGGKYRVVTNKIHPIAGAG